MIRCSLITLLLSLGMHICFAQTPLSGSTYADSLNQILKSAGNDSVKARANLLLSEYWYNKDKDAAQEYLAKGNELGKRYPYLKGLQRYFEAYFYYDTDKKKSQSIYLTADSLLKEYQNTDAYYYRSKVWRRIGALKQTLDDEKAFTDILLNKAIPFARQSGDSVLVGDHYLALGIVFKNQRQLDKAEEYCLKAIRALKNAHAEPGVLAKAYYTIAENYVFEEKYAQTKAMLDSAKVRLSPYPDSEHFLRYYAIEGMYFTVVGQFDDALVSLDRGIALAQKRALKYEEQTLLFQKFYVHYNNKEYRKAEKIFLELLEQKEIMSLAINKLQIYQGLTETYVNLGDMKQAYEWQKKYSTLSDSLHTSKLKSDINALEIKYNNAEKEKRIARLEAENEMASLAARNNRLANWLLGIISLFFLLVVLYSYFYYRKDKKLAFEKEQNYRNQLTKLKQDQQLMSAQAMLKGEELERKRMAQDLHDGLGGILTGVRMNLSHVETKVTKTLHDEINSIGINVDKSMKELRRIAHNLMPESLSRIGLSGALEDLCKSYETRDFKVDYQPYEIQSTLTETEKLTIYRIVQELLNNALRHSKASLVIVQCSQNENKFYITVEDNGIGFDPQSPQNQEGLGLRNLDHRVKTMDGTIKIISEPNDGTTVNIELNVLG